MNALKNIFPVMFLLITYCSCTKSDSPESFSTYNKVKLFPDSEASPTTAFERIVSGANRLFMTYGHYNQNIYFMVTDNEGKLIKQDSLAPDQYFNGLLSLSDGTFIIIATPFANSYGYIYHFNQDGEKIGVDSIQANTGYISGVANSHNGNIILCAWENSNYILECDVRGNILWSKQTTFPMNFGTRTKDGGYLLLYSSGGDTSAVIYKTNGVGDSLWQKAIHASFTFECKSATQRGNGNYRLSLNNLDTWNNFAGANAKSYVYEVNATGDFVKSTEINETKYNYMGAMFQKDEEQTLILITVFFNWLGIGAPTIVTHTNTHYIVLDSQMKIKERGTLQSDASDLFDAMCKTSDGKIACFGLIQSNQSTKFKPGLIILN